MNDAGRPGARQYAGNHLLFQHPKELARHPGRKEKPRPANVEGKSTGGADRIVEHLGARRQHRLLAIVADMTRLRRRKNSSMRASHSSLRTRSTPAARAAISCERSSTVGPSPPLTMTASARSPAMRKAASNSSRSSPTVVPQDTDSP